MSGSLLYALRSPNRMVRHGLWGTEFLLAAITANLRVSAGRHYRTDIWTDASVGAGLGLGVPVLHGLDLERVQASEWLTAAGAFALGTLISETVGMCGPGPGGLPGVGRCMADADSEVDAASAVAWYVVPAGVAAGDGSVAPGLLLSGAF